MRNLWLAPALLVLTGCFAYVPAELGEVQVNDRIRVVADPARAAESEPLPGPIFSGRVLDRAPSALLMEVPAAGGGATGGPQLMQRVRVPEAAVREVELRVLQRRQTAGLALGAAALMGYFVYQAFVRKDPAGTPGENPPPADEARWPVRPARLSP